MIKKKVILKEYFPKTMEGKRVSTVLDQLDQRERIFLSEKRKLEKRKAFQDARKRLGLIKPKPLGKKFQSFMSSKIRFG